jgi:hypothetical protein
MECSVKARRMSSRKMRNAASLAFCCLLLDLRRGKLIASSALSLMVRRVFKDLASPVLV